MPQDAANIAGAGESETLITTERIQSADGSGIRDFLHLRISANISGIRPAHEIDSKPVFLMQLKKTCCAPNWIGDAAVATPAIKAIRAKYPDAEITVMVRPSVTEFAAATYVDHV